MTLSIIIPVYNEINFIDTLLQSLITDEFSMEILLVEGGSTDGTRKRIAEWTAKYSFIKMVDNPQRFVSPGFNKAYAISTGKYIAFIGAHAYYPKKYFSTAIKVLENNESDAVGGPLNQMGKTAMGKAIAFGMSSKFGVGDTEFRTSKERSFVQSVAFAVYKRTVFEKVGLLNEKLIRNQDDEFHYRLNQQGFRILMVPEMACTYHVRESLSALFKQYFQYGLYKPLVLKKVKSEIKLRHLIPTFFVMYLLFLLPALYYVGIVSLLPLLSYFALAILFALKSEGNFKEKFYCLLVFPTLHISYGSGFILGLFKK
jgi:glycosyltransferase involved in cell wall biosynthesis